MTIRRSTVFGRIVTLRNYSHRCCLILGTSNLAKQLLFIKIRRSTVFWIVTSRNYSYLGVVSFLELRFCRVGTLPQDINKPGQSWLLYPTILAKLAPEGLT
jgi:hypothetical protein